MDRQTTLISDIVLDEPENEITARPDMFMDDMEEITCPNESEDVANNDDVVMSEDNSNNQHESNSFEKAVSVEVEEVESEHTYGVHILPLLKTKRILKSDPNYTLASEATAFIITKSAEYFVKHIMEKAYMNASTEKRKKIQYKDFSDAVFNNEELFFLKRIIPRTTTVKHLVENNTIRVRKAKADSVKNIMKKNNKEVKIKGKHDLNEKSNPEIQKPVLPKGQQTLNFKVIKDPELKRNMSDLLANDAEKTITSDSTEDDSENDVIVVEDNTEDNHEHSEDPQDDTQVSNGTIDERDDELTEDE